MWITHTITSLSEYVLVQNEYLDMGGGGHKIWQVSHLFARGNSKTYLNSLFHFFWANSHSLLWSNKLTLKGVIHGITNSWPPKMERPCPKLFSQGCCSFVMMTHFNVGMSVFETWRELCKILCLSPPSPSVPLASRSFVFMFTSDLLDVWKWLFRSFKWCCLCLWSCQRTAFEEPKWDIFQNKSQQSTYNTF